VIVRLLRAVLAGAVAAWALTGFGAAARSAPLEDPLRHLYVADSGTRDTPGAVYRFTLKNGLPETPAESVLQGDLVSPFGVAFDRDGNLYVAETGVGHYAIKMYARSATEKARPLRTLPLGAENRPQDVAVDRSGNVFVTINALQVNVYRPLAERSTTPLRIIRPPGGAIIDGLALDSRTGVLYVAAGGAIDVYADPLAQWQRPSQTLRPAGGAERFYEGPLATGPEANDVYAHAYADPCCAEGQSGTVARLKADSAATAPAATLTSDCPGTSGPADFNGLAVSRRYIMAACLGRNVVYVYPNRSGTQSSREKVTGPFVSVGGVTLGP
jgi:DNA-binding beta-propeller fold protein YncE